MTTVHTLSRSIRSSAAAGSTYPWESPYSTEPIATLSHNGANLFHIEMSPSASTRLVTSRIADADSASTRDLDPSILLNRPAHVVRFTATEARDITADELQAAFSASGSIQYGDALVLVTGWGDRDDSALDREEYVLEAPTLAPRALELLIDVAISHGSTLILTDLPHVSRPAAAHADWTGTEPWLRPSWPSANAKAYLHYSYGPAKADGDWAPTLALLEHAAIVLGLVNCSRLTDNRWNLTVAPFQVQDVGEVPCTVVAEGLGDD